MQTLTHNSESILRSYSLQPVSRLQCRQVHSFSLNNILALAPKFVFLLMLLPSSALTYILLKISHLPMNLHRTCHFIHNINLATSSASFITLSPSILLSFCLRIYHHKFISHPLPFLAVPVVSLHSSL